MTCVVGFGGLEGACKMIYLLWSNNPRPGGCAYPRVCIKWYQSLNWDLCVRKLGTMPPRRCRDILVANKTMEEEMR
jgi:hypothetical protein